MKKTFFLTIVLLSGLTCAGESYNVQNASEFKQAWEAATDGDTINVVGDVDWLSLSAPLVDKQGSIRVSSTGTAGIIWQQAGEGIPLPQGMALQDITLLNAPGTLWQGTDITVGQGVRMIQSQGGESAIIVAEGGKAEVLAGAAFSTLVSTGQGGAMRVEDGASATIHGGVQFTDNASRGLGGAIAVENQTTPGGKENLVLSAAQGDIIFSGNQSEASETNGVWLGFSNDVYLGENATMKLDAREGREIRLLSGVESADGTAQIVKTGQGSATLGEGGFYAGSLNVQEGSVIIAEDVNWGTGETGNTVNVGESASLVLRQGATLGAASLRLEKGAFFTLDGATLESSLEMAGSTLTIESPSTINSPAITLSASGNTWTYRVTDELLSHAGQPLLQFSPETTITPDAGGRLTLNVDFSRATSTQGIQKLSLTGGLNPETMETLRQVPVTCTDSRGTTHQTNVSLDEEGGLNLGELLPYISFDRPGRAAVNALHSSAGALRSLDDVLHGQMPLHHTRQAGSQLWGSALGYYDDASSAYRYSGGGYAVGATCTLGHQTGKGQTLAGMALGQLFGTNKARLDGDSDAAAEIEQTAMMLALYGRHDWNRTPQGSGPALDVTLAYGLTDNDYTSASHRSSWDDNAFYASTRFSWELRQEDGTCITPFIGLEYTAASQDAATFAGATGNWRSDGADISVLSLPVGVAIHRSFGAGNGKIFTPQLEILYRGDLSRKTPSATMTDGYATWTSEGASPARSAVEVRGTLHLQITEDWAAWATGGFETRSDRTSTRFSVGTSYAF